MTILVAIKYDDGVVFGCDSQASRGYHLKEKCTKYIRYKESNTILALTGYLHWLNPFLFNKNDIISKEDLFDKKEIDKYYVYDKILPTVVKRLEDKGFWKEKPYKFDDTCYMFCTAEGIYTFYDYNAMYDATDIGYCVLGCGDELALGVITNYIERNGEIHKKIDAIACAKEALNAACESSTGCGYDLNIEVLE